MRENRTLGSVGANAKWLSDPITPPDEVLSVLAGTRRGVERLEAAGRLRRLVTPKDSLPHCGMASANRSRTACRRGPCLRWRRRPIASSIMRGHARASIPDQLTARDGEDQRRRNRSQEPIREASELLRGVPAGQVRGKCRITSYQFISFSCTEDLRPTASSGSTSEVRVASQPQVIYCR